MPIDLNLIDGQTLAATHIDQIEAAINDLETQADASTVITAGIPSVGAWSTWTPVVTQSGSPTITIFSARYYRVGRKITFEAVVTCTSNGTATSPVVMTLPVTGASQYATGILLAGGIGKIEDVSASTQYLGMLQSVSTTTVSILPTTSGGTLNVMLGSTGSGFTAALASGDYVKWSGTYEAAS